MFKIHDLFRPLYTCPMCRKDFDSHEGANDCIATHVKPVLIQSFDDIEYHGEISLPETIIVIMSDESKVEYVFQRFVYEDA